jgi:hypothetical protein
MESVYSHVRDFVFSTVVRGAQHDAALRLKGSNLTDAPGWHEEG